MRDIWKKKLAAWLHDPAEKALVLMRDVDTDGQRIGHEEGSVAALREALGIAKSEFNKHADHYAAAADRPQWPYEKGKPRPTWANVQFVKKPVLIHPLSSEQIDIGNLTEIAAPHIRHVSFAHFHELIETDATGQPDYRLTQLAFWRFGPEPRLVAPELGELWRHLPADTRVPDHSIWSHLDVVSALTGAMDGDRPALLSMSFGPVQGFIAQARSMSDLWAGSHLLSSLVWEGLRVICEELGPDAVIFPHLRGLATVDRWLLDTVPSERRSVWEKRFNDIGVEWLRRDRDGQPSFVATDANPLFAATLPNKFMALVPAARAQALAWSMQAAECVFAKAQGDVSEAAHWRKQVADQLRGFPEVHWSVAEWSVEIDEQQFPLTEKLEQSLASFYPEKDSVPGFFGDPLWTIIAQSEVTEHQVRSRKYRKLQLVSGEEFFVPNPGLLYPAIYDLAERSLAATKSLRDFDALAQGGYRCTISGEHEWLTDNEGLFDLPHAEQKEQSVWAKVAGSFGIKPGEHLGALATMKRLWPTLFSEQIEEDFGDMPDRFVVSTHTMALATSMDRFLNRISSAELENLSRFSRKYDLMGLEPVTLPANLHKRAFSVLDANQSFVFKRLPTWLDGEHDENETDFRKQKLESLLGDKPETYYALIQMDGDRMGAWMAGNEEEYRSRFIETWHPQVAAAVQGKFGTQHELQAYMNAFRAASPARHAAISKVLNDFSTHVARHVVEEVFKGKLFYAGGDDVLAMVSVDDLLPAMLLLRATYSGVGSMEDIPGRIDLKGLKLGKGYVYLHERLMLMMGSRATASMGAVVAHHKAPMSAVLRELRSAEKRAKDHGRNAFCLRVMKRGGGEVSVTSRFWSKTDPLPMLKDTPLGFMLRFADTLANSDMSRRAIYNTTNWLALLPSRDGGMGDDDWQEMVTRNLAYQLDRQGGARHHAGELVALGCRESQPADTARFLDSLLVTTEFFAREGRAFGKEY